jgi:hypothetical protein
MKIQAMKINTWGKNVYVKVQLLILEVNLWVKLLKN